jgi:hypothetical protein
VGNRTLGENGGTPGKREALKDADEVDSIDGKQRALVVGDADARGTRRRAGFPRVLHD